MVITHGLTAEHLGRTFEIGAVAPETLLTEIIRHTDATDFCDAFQQALAITTAFAQHDTKAITGQRAALQLARMAMGREYFYAGRQRHREIGRFPSRQMHAEPLRGDRMAILHAGVTDRARRYAGGPRQGARNT